MRYLRLLVIFALILWSYFLVKNDPPISINTHSFIQEDLRNIIKIAIQDALPDAKEISFKRMNTENISENVVRANFIYGFTSLSELGNHRIEIEGQATLNRYQTTDFGDNWSLDKIQLGDETLEFQEPIIIEVEL